MKRETLAIFETFAEAWYLTRALVKAGLDVKVVTKHAVQIRPDQVEAARAAVAAAKAEPKAKQV